MRQATKPYQKNLITRWDYIKGRLSLLPRLFAIKRYSNKIEAVDVENLESWGSMLEENASRFRNRIALKSEEATLTYLEYNQRVNRYANYFISTGLKKDNVAVVMLENRPELLVIYSAMAKIGVINAMINTNLRKDSLLHCMNLNPASVYIIGEEVFQAFDKIRDGLKPAGNGQVCFVKDNGKKPVPRGCVDLVVETRNGSSANPSTTAAIKPADTLAFVFTSGTTGGLPKAAIIPHVRVVRSRYFNGNIVLDIKPRDTIYIPLPFFHTNALTLAWPCVFANGAAVAIRRKFSTSRFWEDVRKYDATSWCYIGELCRYLINQPPRADDRENPLKKMIGNGLRPDIWKPFKKRFDVPKVYEIYGAAESNLYFVNLLNLDYTQGICSLPYAIIQYDIDEETPTLGKEGFMKQVAVGEAGLLLGEISDANLFKGYTDKKETESKILRNVFKKGDAWFNTGDIIKDIGYGHVRFVDRLGDTFRWKGENVSTTEVEKFSDTFPQVYMSTVYGVEMPGGDGRAGMVALIPGDCEDSLDLERLAHYFMDVLPSYAVPKFIRVVEEFDYTPTHKIKKLRFKKEGFDPQRIKDPIYVLLPGEQVYKPLDRSVYQRILEGKYKF